MKKIIILFGIFIITLNFGCQKNHSEKKTSWDTDGLKGNVKILRTFQYKAIDSGGIISKGQMIDNNYGNVLIKYNRNGDWIEYRSFTSEGNKSWSELPRFDKKGNMTLRNDYSYTNYDSTLVRRYESRFDRKGNLIESIRYNGKDSITHKYFNKYDSKGNLIESFTYNSTDSLLRKTISIYDENNNLMDVNSFIAPKKHSITKFKYNNNSKQSEKHIYNSDNLLETKTLYEYNNMGHWKEVRIYNSNDELIENNSFDYEYDEKGNWVKKIEFKNNIATRIIERQILYFE